jgi:hypothetical protein
MKPSPLKSMKTAVGKKRSREEAAGSAERSTPPVSPPRPNPNKEWKKSKARTEICWRYSIVVSFGRKRWTCGVPPQGIWI